MNARMDRIRGRLRGLRRLRDLRGLRGLRGRRAGRWVLDVLLWAVLALPAVAEGAPGMPDRLWMPALPVLAVAVAVSRRRPLLALALPVALSLAVTPDLFVQNYAPALVVFAYLLGLRSGRVRGVLVFLGGVCAVGLPVVLFGHRVSAWHWFTLVLTVLFALLLPWLLGRYARRYAELSRTGWELAERLEREQELVADRIRLRERARIAGDMHDSLGHELSLIAVRAAALQVSPGLADAEREAAAQLREAAATATERLREIIGVLREDDETAPVVPADDTLEALVRRAEDSGMTVTLAREGEQRPLAPMPDRAAYRTVQEALTNAAKHAPGAAVTVTVRGTPELVEVVVTNTDSGAEAEGTAGAGGGYGLVGLAERVRLAGGTVEARHDGGGFRVTARLPREPGARAAAPAGQVARRELASARRRLHRGLFDVVWVPVVLTAVVGLGWGTFQLFTNQGSALGEDVYDGLRVGRSQSSVEREMPRYELDARDLTGEPETPPGVDACRWYMITPHSSVEVYRLCFTDGRLSHKDVVTTGA